MKELYTCIQRVKNVELYYWNLSFSCLISLCSELNTTASAGDLSTEELQNITTTIVNDVQAGSTLLNLLNSTGVAIAEPPPDPEDPNWQVVLSDTNVALQTLAQPSEMRLSITIVPLHEGAPFSTQPKLQIYDSSVSVFKSISCNIFSTVDSLFYVSSKFCDSAILCHIKSKHKNKNSWTTNFCFNLTKFTILGKKYLDLKICKECFLVINTEIKFFAFNKESGKQHLNLDLLKFQEILSVNLPKTFTPLLL